MTALLAYYRAHRKAVAGAISTAVAAYTLQIANGATAIDWRPILAAVIAGLVGGGAVHQATNTP